MTRHWEDILWWRTYELLCNTTRHKKANVTAVIDLVQSKNIHGFFHRKFGDLYLVGAERGVGGSEAK